MKKTVLITGAGGGLGLALVACFLEAGWNVIANSRHPSVVDTLEQMGAKTVWGDITVQQTRNIAACITERGLDVVIHNAGCKPLPDGVAVARTVLTNLVAPILLTHLLWPALKQRKGLVVFVNSLAGKVGGEGEGVYAASKAGLRGYAQSLQYEAVRDGMRVLSVFPGAMQTPMCQDRPDYDKLIDPAEVAGAILQLCNDQSNSMRITEVDIHRRRY
jgi:NAD(P)-dependent dehydrogenase (short-subunit alcohol dehydrogenase family)